MARGKQTCKILKDIRRQIAEANGIEFATSECRYKGDCLGTCPKCEAEVRYLEQQLRARSLAGKAIALAGISAASLAMLMPISTEAQTQQECQAFMKGSIPAMTDTITVKGIVLSGDTLPDGGISKEPLIGCTIFNRRSEKGTVSNIDGEFSIPATVGDTLEVRYVGYKTKKIVVTEDMKNTSITLVTDPSALSGLVEVIAGMVPVADRKDFHFIDLNVVDEKGHQINPEDIYIESPRIYKSGEEDIYYIHPDYVDEKHPCRIYWDAGMCDEDGKPLKEAILRIEAEGYDNPITIKVKYPKRNAKKTIKFKHKKK